MRVFQAVAGSPSSAADARALAVPLAPLAVTVIPPSVTSGIPRARSMAAGLAPPLIRNSPLTVNDREVGSVNRRRSSGSICFMTMARGCAADLAPRLVRRSSGIRVISRARIGAAPGASSRSRSSATPTPVLRSRPASLATFPGLFASVPRICSSIRENVRRPKVSS